jgi:uncharacterized membrane protein
MSKFIENTLYKAFRCLPLLLLFLMMICSIPAHAQYDYQLIDSPDAPGTQVFGINDRGDVVGNGNAADAQYPFVYSSKKGTFTDVAPAADYDFTGVLGISDSGVMVGSVFSLDTLIESGFIRNKKGTFSVFDHPDALTFTQARAVNNKGLVTGIRFEPYPFGGETIFGFIYDPKSDTFTDIIPVSDHDQSIAQGINSKGEVVGSAWFNGELDPCNPGTINDFQRYGWLRATDGTVTYFQVNGDRTAARGINDSGTIVGFAIDPADGKTKGFVVELDGSQCQAITIASGDLLEFPGYDTLFAQGITNSGVIVGGANDLFQHGFIATPQ